MMKMPVNEWSCSQHDYPQYCEHCDTWSCEECERSEWAKVGERDASAFEEMLMPVKPSFPTPFIARAILGEVAS